MIEYEAVLTRAEHLEASRISKADVLVILDAIAAIAVPVHLSYRWRPLLADPDDDMVFETAANGRADLLVTLNRRDFEHGAGHFKLKVVSPGEAVVRLRKRL